MSGDFLDASAVLALLQGEPGADAVRDALHRDARISAVNFAEVVSKLVGAGVPSDEAVRAAALPELEIVELNADVAADAGVIHAELRLRGLGLADAVCIAAGRAAGASVVTADRQWASLGLDVEVRLIR